MNLQAYPSTQVPHSSWLRHYIAVGAWNCVRYRIRSHPKEATHLHEESSALHQACSRTDCPLDIIQDLIRLFPEAIYKENDRGVTPLYLACLAAALNDDDGDSDLQSNYEIISILFRQYPEAVCRSDRNGTYPIHIAALFLHDAGRIVSLFLEYAPELASLRNCLDIVPTRYMLDRALRCGSNLFRERVDNVYDFSTQWIFFIDSSDDIEDEELRIVASDDSFWRRIDPFLVAIQQLQDHTRDREAIVHTIAGNELVDDPRLLHAALLRYPEQCNQSQRSRWQKSEIKRTKEEAIMKTKPLNEEKYESVKYMDDMQHSLLPLHLALMYSNRRLAECDVFYLSERDYTHLSAGIEMLVETWPDAAMYPFPQDGNYPLHFAIKNCMLSSHCISRLVDAHPDALRVFERKTNLSPFMLAATKKVDRDDCLFSFEGGDSKIGTLSYINGASDVYMLLSSLPEVATSC